jgi:hypothetical protein
MTAGASALLVVIGGATAGLAVATDDDPRIVTAVGQDAAPAAAAALPAVPDVLVPQPPAAGPVAGAATGPGAEAVRPDRRTSDAADRTATRAPRTTTARPPSAGAAAALGKPPVAAPVITTRTVIEKRSVPFRTRLVRDPDLPRGSKRLQAPGVPGEETLRYLVTYTDGTETARRLVDSAVTREPQHRVIAFGARRGSDRPRDCGPGSDRCRPTGRTACPDGLGGAVEENGALPLDGTLALLDEDLSMLDPDDLDGLELDPALLCG